MINKVVPPENKPEWDAIIIGAGVCGLYTLHKLRQLGLKVLVLETADDLGGTWYWNNYPGARFDSESYSYGYTFDRSLWDDWNWSEHFAGQPETLRYLNFVADRLELRPHMRFKSKVKSARYDETSNRWSLETEDGESLDCRFLLTAIGMLSAATEPKIKGVGDFKGVSLHTYYWPKEGIDLTDKNVAVIGTGATGVQVISEIADKVGSLTVFQRRPNWCAPLHNSPIRDEEQGKIKSSLNAILEKMKKSPGGFIHGPDYRLMKDVPEKERLAFWEELYASPGFGIWLGNFRDVLVDAQSNAVFSDFIADKIRQRVNDPEIAELLIPKDHGFGSRRVPMETRYYEAYNRDNVRLVDVSNTPIERITATGVQTSTENLDFDVIVFATGFDAITGAFDRMNIEGLGGRKLRDKWYDGPSSYLGLQTEGFPNLFTLAGPQSASVSSNFPPAIQFAVEWMGDFVKFLQDNDIDYVEPTVEAEMEWQGVIENGYSMSLLSTAKSWFTGYNSNVEGHDKLRHMIYLAPAPTYRAHLNEIASNGYEGFRLKTLSPTQPDRQIVT